MTTDRFPLGPRASLLLGILGGGSTLLATEIVTLIERAGELDDSFLDFLSTLTEADVRETLAALAAEGPTGVERLLGRLETAGYVQATRIVGQPIIWRCTFARRRV